MKTAKLILPIIMIPTIGIVQSPILVSCSKSDSTKSIDGSDWQGVFLGSFSQSDYDIDYDNKSVTYKRGSRICASDLVIPNYVKYKNTEFRVLLGENCFFNNINILNSVELNDFITDIPHDCFNGCERLTNLVFHKRPTSFDYFACYNCQNLTTICVKSEIGIIDDWTSQLIFVGDSAFAYTPINGNFIASSTLLSIGNNAFKNCSKLESVNLSFATDLQVIGDSAFSECKNVKILFLPPNISWIGSWAFFGCRALIEIYVDHDINNLTLGDFAFASCPRLKGFNKNINLSSNCGKSCFTGDTQLDTQYWSFPNSMPFITASCFEGTGFSSIAISPLKAGGPADIGSFAFANCLELHIIDVSYFTSLPEWTGQKIFKGAPAFGTIYVSDFVWNDGNVSDEWYQYFSNLGLEIAPPGDTSPKYWHFDN